MKIIKDDITQVQFNKEVLIIIKDLTEKVKILQDQVNKHEITIGNWVKK